MIRVLILVLSIIASSMIAHSQQSICIFQNDGSKTAYPIENIDSITIINNFEIFQKNNTSSLRSKNVLAEESTFISPCDDVPGKDSSLLFNCFETGAVLSDARYAWGDVVIPSEIRRNGRIFPVVEIAADAFRNSVNVESVSIPSTIKIIRGNIFSSCSSLLEIIVDEGNLRYSSIDGVLYNKKVTNLISVPCQKMAVSIPSSVTSISHSAFKNSRLISIRIPSSVKLIGPYAFYKCQSLESVDIEGKINILHVNTFGKCINLSAINIPESIAEIDGNVFQGCKNLKNVTLSGNTKYLPSSFEKRTEIRIIK